EEEGVKIHLKKGDGLTHTIVQQPLLHQQMPVSPAPLTKETPPVEAKPEGKKAVEIKAPMVGTFYRAPAPDADPYVEVGSIIKEGTVLCIIEAMKLMNEIKAEVSGKIVEIPVENGHPIEFGQVLFLVEPV
ncbi:MAG: acetyl-CoA carboxylase biotin carboxyl carrier protein, partial [Candidatus Omnitrophica bacterium]|nr:acetyl-CoA carboxylase biotin carboxyl carrier protein [Candidatus Omnitrophota bacterium]